VSGGAGASMRWSFALVSLMCTALAACGGSARGRHLSFSGSALGEEGTLVRAQLDRFAAQHPGVDVAIRITPDAANQRHQLYVQWLNAQVAEPDVLQLDIVWTAEFAAAGWIRPFASSTIDADDFFPSAIEADRWRGELYAVPWFVDAGLLYWRTDLVTTPPASLDALRVDAMQARRRGVANGLVWSGARYEGLVTVFIEYLAAFGGRVLDERGGITVNSPPAVRALTFMRDSIGENGFVPVSALTWQEEQVRFAFQNGDSAFMRNWPYAWTLLQDDRRSRVANRIAVAPLPAADGGAPSSALGGAQLAINRYTREPDLAQALVEFLTAPAQMLERARVASQLPARRSLYDDPSLARALALPVADIRTVLDATVARPVTPVYSELSEILQVHLHRALKGQESPSAALDDAASEMRLLLDRSGLRRRTDR
jgi:ABC-type glycerol-3-phosphate transport system substrate-binding protein